ncbi:flagellar motor switch protein FliG [Actinoplanes capillaceus]|uniref:Flagellar motor switch protein FliG n=2 Tax=Actinoplanes campanulatus TaxID=113559 RepID=A0ABQ3WEW3_9ACTN|nr:MULTISPECIES: flagellar motor switch protein FliG [Actinoplanes]GGN15416.1 flagellar motor switch protein FliG [Actinoplanes campanulatus]GID37754.1 flagellar motor switch protein FliG [Actinoplanes campanulatus]GID43323.1 flagellar motor switch protein FliG [Actinoplanes capillaceus]
MTTPQLATMSMTGARKAAIMLVQFGKEQASQVMANLTEKEVEMVSAEVARLGKLQPAQVDDVMDEFYVMATTRYAGAGGMDYARELLEASLGSERAALILDRLEASMDDIPFNFLSNADPRQLLSYVQYEHPQTIALVLAHIPSALASSILANLPLEVQTEVAHRIAIMDRTSPDIIRQVESALQRKLSSVLQPDELSTVGGLQPLVDIINRADRTTERLILEALETRSPELAEEIRRRMFMFEDIVNLDDRAVQLILRQVEPADLATALKGVPVSVRDKVTGNLSERGRENLLEEMDLLGPVKVKMVEESQAKIVGVIRSLEDSGQIEIQRGGEADELIA